MRTSIARLHTTTTRRKSVMVLTGLVLAATPVCAPSAGASACRDANLLPNGENHAQVRGAIRCLINEEREERDLVPVKANRELRRVGERYSALMVREHFYAHVSPSGSTVTSRVKRTSYLDRPGRWFLGETLAIGIGSGAEPQAIVEGWMKSATHRRQILRARFRDVGIGIVRGVPFPEEGTGSTFNAVFGRRGVR